MRITDIANTLYGHILVFLLNFEEVLKYLLSHFMIVRHFIFSNPVILDVPE